MHMHILPVCVSKSIVCSVIVYKSNNIYLIHIYTLFSFIHIYTTYSLIYFLDFRTENSFTYVLDVGMTNQDEYLHTSLDITLVEKKAFLTRILQDFLARSCKLRHFSARHLASILQEENFLARFFQGETFPCKILSRRKVSLQDSFKDKTFLERFL